MGIMITEKTVENGATYFEMVSEKKSVFVAITECYVKVLVRSIKNAGKMGYGKTFMSIEEAVNNYKSAEVKEMILLAQSEA